MQTKENILKQDSPRKCLQGALNNFFGMLIAMLIMAGFSCKKLASQSFEPVTFVKGADVGWLSQMEHSGVRFYDSAGANAEPIALLKSYGINSIRLRVWANPANGWCSAADVVALAKRAQQMGMRLLIDFHYSDTWADPGAQHPPANWVGLSLSALADSLAAHTTYVLKQLKQAGITPTWVQVGNETNNGMLWPLGKASENMSNFATLFKAGYQAVKSIDTSIKVIAHISNGHDNELFKWILGGLAANGAVWDVTAMSLYPEAANWPQTNNACLANVADMISRFGKPVMIVEVGMPWDQPDACHNFIKDLIIRIKAIPNNMGLGVLYWEPQCHNNWQGYTKGAFLNNGRPSHAFRAFRY
jgi:arabinogalactan endo-1,4-beta-galactosidase